MAYRINKIVSVNTSDVGGGAERIAWDLFKGYQRQGVESWMIVGDKKSSDERVLPFYASPFCRIGWIESTVTRRKREWLSAFCRRRGIDDFEFPYSHRMRKMTGAAPDAIHCHNLHGGYFDLRALVKLSRSLPVFLTLHDAWLSSGHCASPMGCSRWRTGCGKCPALDIPPACNRDATALNWWRKAGILKRCKLYVASPSVWLMDHMKESILAPAIVESRVIPHGINLELFHPRPKAQAREELSEFLPQDGHLVVFAANEARSNPFKDFETIRSALQKLAAQRLSQRVHFVAIGEAGEPEQIGNLTLHSVARSSQATLAKYFQAADLYLHAARAETFGLVIAEAMACGTAVVATAVGGIPEVLGREQNGILAAPHDSTALYEAVRRLLDDDAMRNRMGDSAARDARQRFCGQRMIRDYLDWFTERVSLNRRSTGKRHSVR